MGVDPPLAQVATTESAPSTPAEAEVTYEMMRGLPLKDAVFRTGNHRGTSFDKVVRDHPEFCEERAQDLIVDDMKRSCSKHG